MTPTTPESMQSVADRITACLTNLDIDGLVSLCGPETVLDMNVPVWRAQYQGPEAIRAYFEPQLAAIRATARCTRSRSVVAGETIVIESEFRFETDSGEHLWREVDLFDLTGGTIVRHTQYCTGVWTPDDVARQAIEAPMVRW